MILLAVIVLVGFGARDAAGDEPSLQYGFQEGEPLAYQMDIAITDQTTVETRFHDRSDKSPHDSQVNLRLDYQLMPISQTGDGLWKVRIVLDKMEEALTRDSEIKRRILDRDELGISPMRQVSQVTHINLMSPELRGEAPLTTRELVTNSASLSLTSAAEELFADPVVASIKPDGTIQKFEDRTELSQVIPGFNVKECLELALPPLLVPALKEGATWTRSVPVDLPQPPLPGHQADAMKLALNYSVQGIGATAGKRSARIRVQGNAVFDGLSIPIRQEEIKYLIWTTRVTRIDDSLEGEYFFDLDSRTVSYANIASTYRFSTMATRKEDKQRGKIFSDTVVRTRITARQTNSISSDAQRPDRAVTTGGAAPATPQSTALSAVPK